MKALEAGHCLRKLGEFDVCIDEVVAEATGFIAACYGSKERNSMSDVRKDVWSTKMGKPKVTTTPVGCQVGTTNFGSNKVPLATR